MSCNFWQSLNNRLDEQRIRYSICDIAFVKNIRCIMYIRIRCSCMSLEENRQRKQVIASEYRRSQCVSVLFKRIVNGLSNHLWRSKIISIKLVVKHLFRSLSFLPRRPPALLQLCPAHLLQQSKSTFYSKPNTNVHTHGYVGPKKRHISFGHTQYMEFKFNFRKYWTTDICCKYNNIVGQWGEKNCMPSNKPHCIMPFFFSVDEERNK